MLMVSYCDRSMSVVRRPSSVVRRAASTIALQAYSSYTPGHMYSKLDRKHRGGRGVTCRLKIAMAAILKIYFSLLLLNQKAN